MTEAVNSTLADKINAPAETIAVVVPLFPFSPALRQSVASLLTQTRPPDLVVLLDDGKSPDIDDITAALEGLNVQIFETQPGPLGAALNSAVEYLSNYNYVSFLLAGDSYHPQRLEMCLSALRDSDWRRPPVLAVTHLAMVDARGQMLPPEDPRAAYFQRLWAPGNQGITSAEWLGTGNFVATLSNVFARRAFLADLPASDDASLLAYHLAVLAGVQGLMAVLHDTLLTHHVMVVEREPSARVSSALLQLQLRVLQALRDRLPFSHETRRNLASFHRVAWNNLSGLREDLFQQMILLLASLASPEDAGRAMEETFRSFEAQSTPPHWRALHKGADPLDLAAYASALKKTQEQLTEAETQRDRLTGIALAARESGWVRFGAWIGERSSRKIFDMDQDRLTAPQPNAEVQSGGEAHPEQVGNEQPAGESIDAKESAPGQGDGQPEQQDLDKSSAGPTPTEEDRRP